MNALSKKTQSHGWKSSLQRSTQSLKRAYNGYIQHRRERQVIRQLLQLNDHVLKDMGLTRSDLQSIDRCDKVASKRTSKIRQLKIKRQRRRKEECPPMLPR